MDVVLGDLHAQFEQPQTRKFAWPVVILPELFASSHHLKLIGGQLVTLGWDVYLVDLINLSGSARTIGQDTSGAFDTYATRIMAALSGIGSDVIAAGHGLGGLLALKLAESQNVKAAVAFAPLLPGVRSRLTTRHFWSNWRWTRGALPSRRTLLDLVSDADPVQRSTLVNSFRPMDTRVIEEIALGRVGIARNARPRMIIAGENDVFAPKQCAAQFAAEIGAQFASLPGRGHWLIGSRGVERAVAQMQRFLVRALGEQLLLLYQDEEGAV
jgi:pimeloyl-ACP methyl ester carboxylesterase